MNDLTLDERRVLDALVEGLTTDEACERLGIDTRTQRTLTGLACRKLGAQSEYQLGYLYGQLTLVDW